MEWWHKKNIYDEGTRLLLELVTGQMFEVTYAFGDGQRLSVRDILELSSGNTDDRILHFYMGEILNITVLSKPEKMPIIEVYFTPEHLKKCKALALDYKYIDKIDKDYYSAIKVINNYTSVTVYTMGNVELIKPISLLLIATKICIFIFDWKVLLKNNCTCQLREIQKILIDKDIQVVVHDSRQMNNMFKFWHKIKLTYVFDTMIADRMLRKRDENIDIDYVIPFAESVEKHLGVPAGEIDNILLDLSYEERPLMNIKKINAAFNASYLFHLKIVVEKKMLRTLNKTCERYLTYLADKSPFEAMIIRSERTVPPFFLNPELLDD